MHLFWWWCFEISLDSSEVLVLFKPWRPFDWSFFGSVCVRVVLKKAATMQCDDWILQEQLEVERREQPRARYDMWFVIHKMTTTSYLSCTVYIWLWYYTFYIHNLWYYIYVYMYLQHPPVLFFCLLAKSTKFQPLKIKNAPGSFLEQEKCPWKIIPGVISK